MLLLPATFQCETLDDPEQSSFLRKDFAVDVRRPIHTSVHASVHTQPTTAARLHTVVRPLYARFPPPSQCKTSFHVAMMGYAGAMVLVYPLGIPLLYAYLLFWKHGKSPLPYLLLSCSSPAPMLRNCLPYSLQARRCGCSRASKWSAPP